MTVKSYDGDSSPPIPKNYDLVGDMLTNSAPNCLEEDEAALSLTSKYQVKKYHVKKYQSQFDAANQLECNAKPSVNAQLILL